MYCAQSPNAASGPSSQCQATSARNGIVATTNQPNDAGALRRSFTMSALGITERDGESEACDAPTPVFSVFERQDAAVRLGDLAAEHEADACSRWLRRVERHEQIGRRGEPGP